MIVLLVWAPICISICKLECQTQIEIRTLQLDYRQFLLKLESISGGDVSKPVPYQDYVGQYVKAYYIPESELEGWVKEHNQVKGVSRGVWLIPQNQESWIQFLLPPTGGVKLNGNDSSKGIDSYVELIHILLFYAWGWVWF